MHMTIIPIAILPEGLISYMIWVYEYPRVVRPSSIPEHDHAVADTSFQLDPASHTNKELGDTATAQSWRDRCRVAGVCLGSCEVIQVRCTAVSAASWLGRWWAASQNNSPLIIWCHRDWSDVSEERSTTIRDNHQRHTQIWMTHPTQRIFVATLAMPSA